VFSIIQETVPPAVSLELAKSHLKITHAGEDALIRAYIAQATQFVEQYSGVRIIKREITLRAAVWKSWYKLPRPNTEVLSATASGDDILLADLVYSHDGTLYWPRHAYNGPYEVKLRAGLVDDVTKVPAHFMGPIFAAIGFLYTNREGQPWPEGLQAQIRTLGGIRL